VGFVQVGEPYRAAGRVAELAAGFPARALRLVGVTGTNGKTTTAYLMRDILRRAGHKTGMVGTIVYDCGDTVLPADRTTPTPFELQAILARCRDAGCAYASLEVSSHALDQGRLGTARFAGALFTNLTREHLDYHKEMDHYFAAKRLLFDEYLEPGGVAMVNLDARFLDVRYGNRLRREVAERRPDVTVLTFGASRDSDYRTDALQTSLAGIRMTLETPGGRLELASPLHGRFNAENLAGGAALLLALGVAPEAVVQAVGAFQGAPGRLQQIVARQDIRVFVDYAHTDDALRNVLGALRDLKPRRLVALFGCGGGRDRGKRPLMGKAVAEFADWIVVSSDNPRDEEPELIINDACCGIPATAHCTRETDRRQAIERVIAEARPGDVIVVAGKGHEDYQEIKGVKYPFDDVTEVTAALRRHGLLPEAPGA